MPKRKLPQTSHAANKAATLDMRKTHYSKILASLGVLIAATYEEISAHNGMDKHQVGRRLKEMEGNELVWKPGTTRKTKSGRMACVYQVRNFPKTEKELTQVSATAKAEINVETKQSQSSQSFLIWGDIDFDGLHSVPPM